MMAGDHDRAFDGAHGQSLRLNGVDGRPVTPGLMASWTQLGIQELQLTTNGQNIRAIEIDGTFDDCQALVKQAFTDPELSS